MHSDDEVAVVERLRQYLSDNPNAEDTGMGVASFWLGRK